MFHDLAVNDAEDVDSGRSDLTAGWRYAKELAPVRAAAGEAFDSLIPLGDHVLDNRIDVWEGRADQRRSLSDALAAGGQARWGAVGDEFLGDDRVEHTEAGPMRPSGRDGRTAVWSLAMQTARTIRLENEVTWGQANSAYNLAMALQETGDYEEALAMARQAVATARCLDFSPLLLLSLAALGTAHRALFQLEEACAAHLEALQIAERLGPPFFTQLSAAEVCADWAVRGDWAQASAYALQALAAGDYSIGYVGLWRWYETEALLRGGAVAEAEEDVRRFGEQARGWRFRMAHPRALAVLAQWSGRLEEAVGYLEGAAGLAREMGVLGERWQVEVALGEVYLARGEGDAAWEAFVSAGEIVRLLGESIEDEEMRSRFLSVEAVLRLPNIGSTGDTNL